MVRHILPACARDALKVVPMEGGDGTFIPNGVALAKADPATETCWGSYSAGRSGRAREIRKFAGSQERAALSQIPVAGNLGEPGLSLELVDLTSGKTIPVTSAKAAGGQWANAYVRAPAGEFKLVARDESGTAWFAFKEPREVGRLSYLAMLVVAGWKKIFLAGGIGVSRAKGPADDAAPRKSDEGRG